MAAVTQPKTAAATFAFRRTQQEQRNSRARWFRLSLAEAHRPKYG